MSVYVRAHMHLQLGRGTTTSSHTKTKKKSCREACSFLEPQWELLISAEPK